VHLCRNDYQGRDRMSEFATTYAISAYHH